MVIPNQIYNRRAQEKRSNLLNQIKIEMGNKCCECGDVDRLQFAHLDHKSKTYNVTRAPYDLIRVEAYKCRLLCCACHLRESAKQNSEVGFKSGKECKPLTGILKICTNCKNAQDTSLFSLKRASTDGLQPTCKKCHYEVIKQVKDKNRIYINSFKVVCCVDGCNKTEALEFDHCKGEKLLCVSQMLTYSKEKIDAEIAKCRVICYKHHKDVTANRMRAAW